MIGLVCSHTWESPRRDWLYERGPAGILFIVQAANAENDLV